MKRYRITTPVPGHTEVIGMVGFVQGVAEVDAEPDAPALKYFRAQGYSISVRGEDGEWGPEPDPSAEEVRTARVAELEAELAKLREAGAAAEINADAGGDPAADLPAKSASKATWVAYAVANGMAAEEAEALSRDQLVERFTSAKEGGQ